MGNVLTALAVVLLALSVMGYDRRIRKLEKHMKDLLDLLGVVELRCPECADRKECPTAGTGVCFPCEHFRKEDPDGQPTKDL